MTKPFLLIYTPANMGMLYKDYGATLIKLTLTLERAGIEFLYVNAECSDIVQGRATALDIFQRYPQCTHLWFLDADMDFDPPTAILEMLAADEDVVAGAYPCRGPDPTWMCMAPDVTVNEKGLIEATHVATGCMLLKRGVIGRLIEAYPELQMEFGWRGELKSFLFFDARPSLDNPNIYISDDYGFCELWRKIGGKLWIYPDITFRHYWTTYNHGNFGEWLKARAEQAAEVANV
mgnify:CR=1 FL=1